MSSPVRYVVRRQEYAPPTPTGIRRVLPEKWTAATTFAKPDEAHAECARLTTDARRTLNPFQLGGPNLFYQTSLPAYALHDYLLDHGITPPPTATSSSPNYVFWWVKNNRTFTDDQRAVVWRACDKLKLFEVAEEDDRQAAHLVVEVPWERGYHPWRLDNSPRCTDEGGFIRSAWRTVRDARRVRQADDDALRQQYAGLSGFNISSRAGYETRDPDLDIDQVPFAELGRVPLLPGEPPSALHLVVRQSYSRGYGKLEVDPARWRYNAEARVAVSAWAGREQAARDMTERVRIARATVNPFTLLVDGDGWGLFEVLLTATEADDRRLPNDIVLEDAVDILRRLDTTPPPPESNELLADWYDQVVQWSPEYIDVIWGTFADFRLFEVIEVPFG